MVLEELDIPNTLKFLHMASVKAESYLAINPNGRVPAIEDPNTGITLWESGSIIEYLIETYDRQHSISFAPGSIEVVSKEYFKAKQWLYFQVSGQGPYFGQAVWFTMYHSEKLPSAIDRYVNEILRVSSVLERALQGKEYLVGGRYSYADAAFVTWYLVVPIWADRVKLEEDFPSVNTWLERVKARPAIAKALKDRDAVLKAKE